MKKRTVKAVATPETPKKSRPKKFKIDAKPLTEAQIKEFLAFYKKNKSFPGSKIPCNITGKLTTCVGPWLTKKIKEFGGAENLLRKYICRGAIKAKKESLKPVSKQKKSRKILKEMKVDEKVWDLPKFNNDDPIPLTSTDIEQCTKDTCLRPDVYLDNDGHCLECEFFDLCSNSRKRLPKRR